MTKKDRQDQPAAEELKNSVVLYGADESGKPRAARFPADQIDVANKAAALMQLSLVKVTTPQLAALAQKLPGGRIYSNGRGFVPYVRRELYASFIAASVGHKSGPHGSTQSTCPRDWDDISVGHLVIAPEDGGPLEGWWEAIVVERNADMLTLRWRDYPHQPKVMRHRFSVALLDSSASSASHAKARAS